MTQEAESHQPLDLRRALEANRRVDEAVAAIEGALWRSPPVPAPALAPTLPPVPAPVPLRPTPSLTTTMVPFKPPLRPVLKTVPVNGAMPGTVPSAPAPAPSEPLGDVERNLDEETANLQRRRTALLEAAVFTLPWDPSPRPILDPAGTGSLHSVTDEDLRDIIQPHWRVLRERSAAAVAALDAARSSVETMPGWKRLWSGRTTLQAAERAEAASREAVETAERIWHSASVLDRRNQMRAAADRAVAAAAAAVEDVPAIDRALAELADARVRLAALQQRGVSSLERSSGETRAQALRRAAG